MSRDTHLFVLMWRPEVIFELLPLLALTLRHRVCLARPAGQGLSIPPSAWITGAHCYSGFHTGCWGLNPCSQACAAGTLPFEPSTGPGLFIYI